MPAALTDCLPPGEDFNMLSSCTDNRQLLALPNIILTASLSVLPSLPVPAAPLLAAWRMVPFHYRFITIIPRHAIAHNVHKYAEFSCPALILGFIIAGRKVKSSFRPLVHLSGTLPPFSAAG